MRINTSSLYLRKASSLSSSVSLRASVAFSEDVMGSWMYLYWGLLGASLVAVPLYIAVLLMLVKYRNRKPFSGSFFRITISNGAFDLLHLLIVWFLERAPRFQWLWLDQIFLSNLPLWHSTTSYLWWWSAVGQKLGVFFTAVNRLSVIGYNRDWTRRQTCLIVVAHWTLPFLLAAPKFLVGVNLNSCNFTEIPLLLAQDSDIQGWYCCVFCCVCGILCGFCYFVAFYRARKVRLTLSSVCAQRHRVRRRRAELKLAVMGVILALLVSFCGFYCLVLFGGFLKDNIKNVLHPIGDVILDVYAWINGFLLLICSVAVRRHFLGFLRGHPLKLGQTPDSTSQGHTGGIPDNPRRKFFPSFPFKTVECLKKT